MNKKCSGSARAVKEISDLLDSHNNETEEVFVKNLASLRNAPENSPEKKFYTAIKQKSEGKIKRFIKGGAKVTKKGQVVKNKLLEPEVKKLLKRYFKNSPDKQNRILLSMKLTSLAASDPAIKDLIYRTAAERQHNIDYTLLSKVDEPVMYDLENDAPDLSTLPLSILRIINRMVTEALNYTSGFELRSQWRHNLFFEFTLPKNVGEKALSMPLNRWLRTVENFKNEKDAYANNFMRPKNYKDDNEALPIDPYTNKPIKNVESTRRHMAGIPELISHVYNFFGVINAPNKRTNRIKYQFENHSDLFEFFSDYRNGKAMFTKGENGNFNVYAFGRDRKVPTGKKYPNGNLVFEWKGKDYTKEQKKKFEKEGKKVPVGNYLEPWRTTNENGYQGVLEFTEEQAREWELINRAFDRISNEIYESLIKRSNQLEKDWKELSRTVSPIMLEKLPQDAVNTLKRIVNLKETLEPEIFDELQIIQKKRQKLVIGTQSGQETYYNEEGDKLIGFPVERYYPDRYFKADLPEIFRDVIKRLTSEIDSLKTSASWNEFQSISDELGEENTSNIDRREALEQLHRAEENKANMERSLYNYLLNDEIYGPEDRYDSIVLPFIKEFKSVKNFIPSIHKRKDPDVLPNYVASVTNTLMDGELALRAVKSIVEEKNAILQNYILNSYLKVTGSPDSKGSFFGITWTDRGFAKTFGMNPRTHIGMIQNAKRITTFNLLGGMTQGIQQLPSMVNKVAEAGLTNTIQAYLDSEKPFGQELLFKAGIFNFQETMENAMENVLAGNVAKIEKERIQAAFLRAKQNIKKLKLKEGNRETVTEIKEQIYLYEKEISKLDNGYIKQLSKDLSNYAINGAGSPPLEDGTTGENVWWGFKALSNLIPITKTEKILRGTSFFIGYNKYMEAHPGLDKFDINAIKAGIAFMNQTDMFLGMEGVGQQFGNEILRFVNSITVWRNQKVGNTFRTVKDMFFSFIPAPEEIGGENRVNAYSKASLDFVKHLYYQNARLLNMAGGASVAKLGALDPAVEAFYKSDPHSALTTASLILGGYAGYALTDKVGITAKKRMLQTLNPRGSSGIMQMLLNTGFAVGTKVFMYSTAGMSLLGAGMVAKMAKIVKRKTFQLGGNQIASGFNDPVYLFVVSAIMALARLEDDDEKNFENTIRVFLTGTGVGGAAIVQFFLAMLGYESGKKEFINILKPENINQFTERINPDLSIENIIEDFMEGIVPTEPLRAVRETPIF